MEVHHHSHTPRKKWTHYYDPTENSDLLINNYYKLYYNGVHFICHDVPNYLKGRATELIKELKKDYHL